MIATFFLEKFRYHQNHFSYQPNNLTSVSYFGIKRGYRYNIMGYLNFYWKKTMMNIAYWDCNYTTFSKLIFVVLKGRQDIWQKHARNFSDFCYLFKWRRWFSNGADRFSNGAESAPSAPLWLALISVKNLHDKENVNLFSACPRKSVKFILSKVNQKPWKRIRNLFGGQKWCKAPKKLKKVSACPRKVLGIVLYSKVLQEHSSPTRCKRQ